MGVRYLPVFSHTWEQNRKYSGMAKGEATVVRTSMCYRRVGKPTCLAMPLAVANNREEGKNRETGKLKFPRRGPPLLLSKKKIPSHRGTTYKTQAILGTRVRDGRQRPVHDAQKSRRLV